MATKFEREGVRLGKALVAEPLKKDRISFCGFPYKVNKFFDNLFQYRHNILNKKYMHKYKCWSKFLENPGYKLKKIKQKI